MTFAQDHSDHYATSTASSILSLHRISAQAIKNCLRKASLHAVSGIKDTGYGLNCNGKMSGSVFSHVFCFLMQMDYVGSTDIVVSVLTDITYMYRKWADSVGSVMMWVAI